MDTPTAKHTRYIIIKFKVNSFIYRTWLFSQDAFGDDKYKEYQAEFMVDGEKPMVDGL
jgi:hypothetical protein